MSINSIFCPRCGSESSLRNRFCRQCGTNIRAVDRALAEPPSYQSTMPHENPLKELQRDIFWRAVRGIVTIVIALPFSFLLIMSGLGVMFMLSSVMLAFVALGIYDLSQAYSDFKDPYAALDKLKAQKEKERGEIKRKSFGSSVEYNGRILDINNSPASITEHTTFELNEHAKKFESFLRKE